MNDLVILSDAKKAVEKAHTIVDVNRLIKLADAVMAVTDSEEMQNQAMELLLRSRRRRGEILKEMPKQTGGDARKIIARSQNATEQIPLTLKEQGIDKREASKDYALLDLSDDEFEELINEPKNNMHRAMEKVKEKKKSLRIKKEDELRKEAIKDIDIRKGDFINVLDDLKDIDCIITDPPYPAEYLDEFSKLSLYASTHLKKDGFCVIYSGEYYLPEVIKRLSEHLTYVWCFCLLHEWQTQLVNGVNIMCAWKPVLIFSNGRKKMRFSAKDVIISDKREKSSHEWQQSEGGVKNLIEIFSLPGELVVDPFSGSGTFCKCAHEMGRNAIGAEIV